MNSPDFIKIPQARYEQLLALEQENDLLRARIVDLQGREITVVPRAFGLTPYETKVLLLLMESGFADDDAIMRSMWGERKYQRRQTDLVKVMICKLRRKLGPSEIAIETRHGRGYRLSADAKARVRALIEAEGK